MEERGPVPSSPKVASPLAMGLPRDPKADTITLANAQSDFIRVGRDVHSIMQKHTQSIRDCVSLTSCCYALWSKCQTGLFNRVLQEAHNRSDVNGLGYLADMIAFNPILREHGINYQHLVTILTRANTLLDTMIKTDPYCAWKIAAVCGLKDLVKKLLGPEMATKVDPYGRGVLAYYALGGQLDCIKQCIEEHGLTIPLDLNTLSVLARLAAIGGQIHVLEYLRDTHGFKLNHIYPATSAEGQAETLLLFAALGGNKATVDFLKQAQHGIDRSVGMNLARVASGCGHWTLYEELAEEDNPLEDIDAATEIAQDAVRHGNLALACRLIEENRLDPKTLALDVINGGDPTTFRYAMKEGWFTLNDTFENGATVQHLLARQGHFDLLIDLLNNDQERNAVYALDDYKQTLLHYAAAGGHWNIYCYLLKHYYQNKALPLDRHGNTVACSAARAGSVWFLKHLFYSEGGPELVQMRDIHGESILFDAAHQCDSNLLIIIIEEFHIDVKSVDKSGNTVLHVLAKLAENDPTYWDPFEDIVRRYPDEGLLDIPNEHEPSKTVRQIIEEAEEEVDAPKHLLNSVFIDENTNSDETTLGRSHHY